jgi:hypothetical protein
MIAMKWQWTDSLIKCTWSWFVLDWKVAWSLHTCFPSRWTLCCLTKCSSENWAMHHWSCDMVGQALGRPQEAIVCYQRSIQLRPDYAIAYGKQMIPEVWPVIFGFWPFMSAVTTSFCQRWWYVWTSVFLQLRIGWSHQTCRSQHLHLLHVFWHSKTYLDSLLTCLWIDSLELKYWTNHSPWK